MRFVTSPEIVLLHDRIIEAIGGSMGIREPGLLIAVTEKPQANFGGQDLYPSLFEKAAAIFKALCNYHVFVDGNKRTAIAVLEYFLYKNDYLLTAVPTEKERFILYMATSNPDLSEVSAWIKKHGQEVKK